MCKIWNTRGRARAPLPLFFISLYLTDGRFFTHYFGSSELTPPLRLVRCFSSPSCNFDSRERERKSREERRNVCRLILDQARTDCRNIFPGIHKTSRHCRMVIQVYTSKSREARAHTYTPAGKLMMFSYVTRYSRHLIIGVSEGRETLAENNPQTRCNVFCSFESASRNKFR